MGGPGWEWAQEVPLHTLTPTAISCQPPCFPFPGLGLRVGNPPPVPLLGQDRQPCPLHICVLSFFSFVALLGAGLRPDSTPVWSPDLRLPPRL